MQSFSARVSAAILLVVSLTLCAVFIALSLPLPEPSLRLHNDRIQLHTDDGWQEVTVFHTSAAAVLPSPQLMIDEPDVLPTHTEVNALMASIGQLTQGLQAGELQAGTKVGMQPLTLTPRRFADLPAGYWMQQISASLGLVICLLVWLPGRIALGRAGFILTGFGYFLLTSAAAVYSTRELFIGESLFRVLHSGNLLGVELFMAGMMVFLWNYPRILMPRWLSLLLMLSPIPFMAFALLQWVDELAWTVYMPFTLMLAIAMAGLITQWVRSRQDLQQRAALRWILLFMASITLPGVLKLYTEVPQALMHSAFVVMYAGMMVAVMYHRLFDIDRWSRKLWSWFLGGLAVVLVDFSVAGLIGLSHQYSLAIAVALVGWLWFPLRQRLWQRLFAHNDTGLQDWLARSLPELLTEDAGSTTDSRLLGALRAVFRPLEIRVVPQSLQEHRIARGGDLMQLALGERSSIEIVHPAEGRRLFRDNDLQVAGLVLSLDELVYRSRAAHAEGRLAGTLEERSRIRQDLHDDLGAKLLRLLHRSGAENQPLVREAIRDLRQLLNTSLAATQDLHTVVRGWQDEAAERCRDHDVVLDWSEDIGGGTLSETRSRHLEMALRESLSNALRHLQTPEIRVQCIQQGGSLSLQIENDAQTEAEPVVAEGNGLGLDHIRQRLALAGGTADITDRVAGEQRQWCVLLQLPLVN